MIRLITTGRLADLTGDLDREATLNNDLLADLEEVTKERDAHAAESRQRGCDAAKWAGLYEQTIAERDQARAIAVDLEQELAEAQASLAGEDYMAAMIREVRDQRDRMAALADTMQAAAEAADIPVVAGLDPDDCRAAVRAVLADIAARKKVAADLRALAESDPEAACRAGEAMADWAARPEAL
ncbi:hypothetical protein [Embleya sp. NPDC020630]|uniref:hypothetical protein n=1 Tax=Embleya sp. NPDC020630 TaxID=3363979 RepID=UPI0037B37F21